MRAWTLRTSARAFLSSWMRSASVVARVSAWSSWPASNKGLSVLVVVQSAASVRPRAVAYAIPVRSSASAAWGPSNAQRLTPRLLCSMATSRPWPAAVASRIASRMSSVRGVADVCACRAAEAERARRAVKAKLVCQGERAIGNADGGVRSALEGLRAGDLAERFDQGGAGGSGSRRASASGGRSAQRGSARRLSTSLSWSWRGLGLRGRRAAWRAGIASSNASLASLWRAAWWAAVGEADQHLGAVGVACGGECECPFEVGERGVGVEAEGAFSGEGEEAPGRVFQRGRLVCLARRRGRGRGRSRSGRRARLRGLRPGRVLALRSRWRRRRGGRRARRGAAGCRRRRG